MIFGYARVSTRSQLENNSFKQQEQEILKRYDNAKIFKEQFTRSITNRPILNKVIESLKEDDVLVVTKLDRLAGSTREGLELIEKLRDKKIKIHILNMGLIEDTPMGNLIVTNLLAFAEFERNLIIERTQQGKEVAKQNPNFKEGRPKKYNQNKINEALNLLTVNGGNLSYKQVENLTGISKSTLIRNNNKKK